MARTKSHRLQLSLVPEDIRTLEALQSETLASTRTQVLEAAIDLLRRLWEEQSDGYQVLVAHEGLGRQTRIVIPVAQASSTRHNRSSQKGALVDFRLTETSWCSLRHMSEQAVAPNRSELCRCALNLYHKVATHLAQGWKLYTMPSGLNDQEREIRVHTLGLTSLTSDRTGGRSRGFDQTRSLRIVESCSVFFQRRHDEIKVVRVKTRGTKPLEFNCGSKASDLYSRSLTARGLSLAGESSSAPLIPMSALRAARTIDTLSLLETKRAKNSSINMGPNAPFLTLLFFHDVMVLLVVTPRSSDFCNIEVVLATEDGQRLLDRASIRTRQLWEENPLFHQNGGWCFLGPFKNGEVTVRLEGPNFGTKKVKLHLDTQSDSR